MLFHVTLTHSPEHCWAREENAQKARDWLEGMQELASQTGVSIRGSFVTPIEHTFYFVLEADDFNDVSAFLRPPLLTDHDAHIAPVTSLSEAADVVLD